jgi:hypothetical protein
VRRFEKWAIVLASSATAVTGLLYAWMRYLLEPVDPFAVINHPWQPWVLKAHILVAPALLLTVGMIAVGHIWKHLRLKVRQGRSSGILAAAVFVPMAWSGYLIQSVTRPSFLSALVVLHVATSVLFVLGFLVHLRVSVRKSRRDAREVPLGRAGGGFPPTEPPR